MNEVIRAAAELQAVCDDQGWRYCFIGGLAVQRILVTLERHRLSTSG